MFWLKSMWLRYLLGKKSPRGGNEPNPHSLIECESIYILVLYSTQSLNFEYFIFTIIFTIFILWNIRTFISFFAYQKCRLLCTSKKTERKNRAITLGRLPDSSKILHQTRESTDITDVLRQIGNTAPDSVLDCQLSTLKRNDTIPEIW